MSMNKTVLSLARCECGRLPGIGVSHAGPVMLFAVECACGARTASSEDETDVVSAWNDGDRRPAAAQCGNGIPRSMWEVRREILAKLIEDPRIAEFRDGAGPVVEKLPPGPIPPGAGAAPDMTPSPLQGWHGKSVIGYGFVAGEGGFNGGAI